MRERRPHHQSLIMLEGSAVPRLNKALIYTAVAEQGYTAGYGALLHLFVLMQLDPEIPKPRSDEERVNWQGHLEGLRAALLCLAMHERTLDPESAARAVDQQVEQARAELERLRPAEVGG